MGRLPPGRVASRIVIPDDLDAPSLDVRDHADWRREDVSRRIGADWVRASSSLAEVVDAIWDPGVV